jgi:hypothetical protein
MTGAHDLGVGDEVEIRGERYVVTKVMPESGPARDLEALAKRLPKWPRQSVIARPEVMAAIEAFAREKELKASRDLAVAMTFKLNRRARRARAAQARKAGRR